MTAHLPPKMASAGWLSATPLTCLTVCLSLSFYCLTSALFMKVKIKLSIILLLNGAFLSIIDFLQKNIFIVKSWSFTCTDVPLAPLTPILPNAEDKPRSICCCYLEMFFKKKMRVSSFMRIYMYTQPHKCVSPA